MFPSNTGPAGTINLYFHTTMFYCTEKYQHAVMFGASGLFQLYDFSAQLKLLAFIGARLIVSNRTKNQ